MKAIQLIGLSIMLILGSELNAQVKVNINIGSPPAWGPAGYTQVRYYYLPDVESYYDIQSSMFIYYSNGIWIQRANLPSRYRNYDLYDGYKVVMTDYRGDKPYTYFKEHKMKYAKGYHGPSQKNIGQKPNKGNSKKMMRQGSPPDKMGQQGNMKNEKHNMGGNNKKDHQGKGNKKR